MCKISCQVRLLTRQASDALTQQRWQRKRVLEDCKFGANSTQTFIKAYSACRQDNLTGIQTVKKDVDAALKKLKN